MVVKIHIEKGALPGYTLKDKITIRRKVLNNLVNEMSWGNIVKKLNVLFIFNRNLHPETADKFKKDMKYIQRQHNHLI